MQPASACLACQPVALQALVQSEPALAALWQALPWRSFGPGAVLQRLGMPAIAAGFESGLVRFYHQRTRRRAQPILPHPGQLGRWQHAAAHPCPAPCTIEALEATRAVELTYATLQHWHRQFPQVQPLLDDAMGYLFTQQARREAELLTLSPEERYQAFLGMDGSLAKRLPSTT